MTDLTGRTLGRYRLEALLGRGGMAEVWRASDTKLARTVAVKVIHASIAQDPHFAERFLREARVVASLEHPNILPIYDFGEEGGLPFLVMPHLGGGTLRDRLQGGAAPLDVGALWIRQLADALDAAHAAGVLHRDVKPANVLLGKDDRLFLADFGIAKMVETLTGLTATGVVVGTPVYMAPEQAQGRPATPATDRYALAVVAYEILSGRPPFDGESPLSLMHQHVSTPAPALSSKVGGLPAGLDAVFRGALSKDPDARPPSCRALADAVSAFLPTGVLPAVGPGAWGTAPHGATAPTVIQTPAPARAASLTSEATVLTRGRRSRRGLVWGGAASAVAVAALVLAVLGKQRTAPETRAAPGPAPAPSVAAPSPSAPSAALPAKTGAASEDERIAALEKRVKDAESAANAARRAAEKPAAPPLPPPPAASGDAVPSAPLTEDPARAREALAAVRERLDVTKKPEHRLSKADFQFALDTAHAVAARHPKNPDAAYLAIYAEGGLSYTAGDDPRAAARAAEAVLALKRAGKEDHRPLQNLLTRADGTVATPRGWELAVAYGDARGEAMPLLDAALAENPQDVRALKARAMLRRLNGLDPDAPHRGMGARRR